jgi:hypothetical protein
MVGPLIAGPPPVGLALGAVFPDPPVICPKCAEADAGIPGGFSPV